MSPLRLSGVVEWQNNWTEHFRHCSLDKLLGRNRSSGGGAMGQWLVRSPSHCVTGDIMLCPWPWVRHFTLTSPLSTQVINGHQRTYASWPLHATKSVIGSCVMGHWAPVETLIHFLLVECPYCKADIFSRKHKRHTLPVGRLNWNSWEATCVIDCTREVIKKKITL